MPRLTVLIACVVAFVLGSVAQASAAEQVVTAGAVTATFSFEPAGDFGVTGKRLQISRAGQVLYDEAVSAEDCEEPSCVPSWRDRNSVHVRDLDGDGEPEVVVDLFWGGAHCCFIAVIFSFDGSGYRVTEHNFADPAYRLSDLDGDGTTEFLTADARFAYRYASFAFSIFPVQVFGWDAGRLTDETSRYPDRIRADVKRNWGLLARMRGSGSEPRGAAAAWAADRYRLGQRSATLRTLRRLARQGRLRGYPTSSAQKWVSKLDRDLLRFGYSA